MDTKNNTPTANPLEVAVRDLCGKVDAYLKQGCTRSELYKANEQVKALLKTNIIKTIRAEIERRKNNAETIRERAAYIDLLDYIDTLLEQPVLPGIKEEGIPGRDFIPVDWVDACERYGKWKIVSAEQPVEGLEAEIENYFGNIPDDMDKITIARHFAKWGASHAVAPHYFKLRELKTGRVFLAEWSDIAGEWYERGDGKAYQSNEVEIIPRDRKTPTQ